jgi:hypothetical protein
MTCNFDGVDTNHPECDGYTNRERWNTSSGACYNTTSCSTSYSAYEIQCACEGSGGGGGGGGGSGSCPAGYTCVEGNVGQSCASACSGAGLSCTTASAAATKTANHPNPACDAFTDREAYGPNVADPKCRNTGSAWDCAFTNSSYSYYCACE